MKSNMKSKWLQKCHPPSSPTRWLALAVLSLIITLPYTASAQENINNTTPDSSIIKPEEESNNTPSDIPPSINSLNSITPNGKDRRVVNLSAFDRNHFIRLFFHSSPPVGFTVTSTEETLSVTFTSPVTIDFDTIKQATKQIIKSVSLSDNGLIAKLALTTPLPQVRQFVGSGFVGLDLFLPYSKEIEDSLEIGREQKKLRTNLLKNRIKRSIPIPVKKPTGKSTSEPENIRAIGNDSPPDITPKDSAIKATTNQAEDINPTIHPSVNAHTEIIDATPKEPTLYVDEKKSSDGITLIFPWEDDTGAAMFRRADSVWIIFSKKMLLDTDKITDKQIIKSFEQIPNDEATILLIKLQDHLHTNYKTDQHPLLNFRSSRENFTWSFRIAVPETDAVREETALHKADIAIENHNGKSTLEVAAAPMAKPIIINDHEVGDKIIVTPLHVADTAITQEYNYTDVHLLKSIQGIAALIVNDSVRFEHSREAITFISDFGLNFSPELLFPGGYDPGLIANNRVLESVGDQNSVFPFKPEATQIDPEEFTFGDEETDENLENETEEESKPPPAPTEKSSNNFINELRKLQHDVTNSSDKEKPTTLYELGVFYFENMLYAEALATFQELKEFFPAYENIHQAEYIIAGSHYLLKQYRQAAEAFPPLLQYSTGRPEEAEIRLWHWASTFQLAKEQKRFFPHYMPVDYGGITHTFLEKYPATQRFHFGMVAVEDFIKKYENDKITHASSLETAKEILGFLINDTTDNVADFELNNGTFWDAKIAYLEARYEDAVTTWETLVNNVDDRFNRARSTYEIIRHKLLFGQIDIQQAIEELYYVNFIWRGDTFELELLDLIGKLYIRNGDFLNGLKAWQALVESFPNTKEALTLSGMMKQIFVQVFENKIVNNLSPFEALALFYEFRDLIPSGERGDSIIQQLSDLFVRADLLENATLVLTHQIRFRTYGKRRFELVLKLADLYLQNNQPHKAQEIFDLLPNNYSPPEDLQLVEKYTRARVETALENYFNALTILHHDVTTKANNLRAEIFWEQENWFGIIRILESKLDKIDEDAPLPLTPRQVKTVMRLAIALNSQSEYSKLQTLRERFLSRITDRQDITVFTFITSDTQSLDHEFFEETVQLGTIEDFIITYAFWEENNWQAVINIVAPRVANYSGSAAELSKEQINDIVRLVTAYTMSESLNKKDQDNWRRILRDFRDVTVNKSNIALFHAFDDRFRPTKDDAVFDKKVPLKSIKEFVDVYKTISSISELNAKTRDTTF